MDMPVSYSFNASAEAAAAASYPSLRYFAVSANYSATPQREFNSVSKWSAGLTPSIAGSFSGVCWFAVRDTVDGLRAAGMGNVAVGMIHSALGGSECCNPPSTHTHTHVGDHLTPPHPPP